MRQTTGTRKQNSSEEKIRIVLDGLRGEDSIAALYRREGISQCIFYKCSKDLMEAGKRRLAGDTALQVLSNRLEPFILPRFFWGRHHEY